MHGLVGEQMHDKTVDKLLHKDAMYQLEWDFKNKFDFSEILADALMQRMRIFLEENNSDNLGTGDIHYWGVKKNEPSGKSLDDMENMNPEHRYNKLSTGQLLEKLQVVVDGRVTVGGLLVFGNEDNINRLLTDFRVDYLEIMGTSYSNAPTQYNYRLYEEENLFRFYFSIFERLMKKIDLPFTLRADGFATDDQPQLIAIREALVNLLMHSDYFSPMKPRIRVFLDRIEFLNPGSLPKDIESIMKEDFTMPRNSIVTRIFRVIKLSENAGSGFDKMFNGWKAYYEDEPLVSGGIDFYKITFPLVKIGEASGETRGKVGERDTIKDTKSEKTREETSVMSILKCRIKPR